MSEAGHLNLHPGLDPEPFTCQVQSIESKDDGLWAKFDRTFFYPRGGGQPADHGLLNREGIEVSVIGVQGRGGVTHKLEDCGDTDDLIGQEFLATIDVQRRNELCRMHTAQHLISAVADEFWGGRTVGNQIRLGCTRIDLGFEERELFDRDQLQEAVNQYVNDDLPISMDFQQRTTLLENPLVRVNMDLIPKHIENLRVITIEGVDICPCAGTHVHSTGQIGDIEIGTVRSKGAGKLRVEYSLNE